jgi:uroporphyrinogen decarboxylase
MILGPELWRKYFKPRMKEIIDVIRAERRDMIIAYHSCGSIRPIIGDLVEIGIDVLNPIQESAADMDQSEIKTEFGDRLTMMCGPDTQMFMPNSSPEEIRAKVRGLISKLNGNFRYIFAVSHTVQPDVSTEKLLAMFDELDKTKG